MCICCLTCCCIKSPMKTINISLFVLIMISLFFSLITTANRAAKTSRFKEDLELLKTYEEQNYYNNLRILRDRTYYYDSDGNKIIYPADEISSTSLFRNWKKGELTVNLLRFFLLIPHVLITFYLFFSRIRHLDLPESILRRTSVFSMISIIFSIILLIFSIIIEYLRALTILTDDEIGYYNEKKTTNFVDRTSWNILLDTIMIVLFSICISFSYRVYYNSKFNEGKNQYQPPRTQQIIKTGQPVIIAQNQPGIIMVDQNGQYLYAQPIAPGQVISGAVYQGQYPNQFITNNQNIPNNQNNIYNNNNNNQQGNINDINEKYNI